MLYGQREQANVAQLNTVLTRKKLYEDELDELNFCPIYLHYNIEKRTL